MQDLTITAPEEPDEDSNKEYETPLEEEELVKTTTKYEKMARFKEKHRPSTPRPKRRDSALTALTLVNKDDDPAYVKYHIDQLCQILDVLSEEYS